MNWTYELEGMVRAWSCLAGKYMANVTEVRGAASWWIQDKEGNQLAAGPARSSADGKLAAETAFMRLPGAKEALAEMEKRTKAAQDKLATDPRRQPLCPYCGIEIDSPEVKAGEISEQRCAACGQMFELAPHVLYTTRPIRQQE